MFKKLLLIAATLVAVLTVSACKEKEPEVVNTVPTITAPATIAYVSGEVLDPLAGVTAADAEDGDLTSSITVDDSDVNLLVAGVYTIELRVEDAEGAFVTHTITVTVALPLANYLSGVDLSKLPGSQKAILFAAVENYLLDNVYGGIPLYTGASRVMYSDRVQLYSPEYNGVLGFGVAFSEMNADDSTIYMNGSEKGVAGEYTFRSTFNTDPTSLNPWNADDSNTATFTDHIKGALYEFFFDASKSGFEILPSLASELPVAVDPTLINGKEYATIWQIELNDDLKWAFNDDTDLASLAALNANYADLDASDYLYTWELAMTDGWFRARTGGGDFISKGILNAAEFLDGSETDFSEVGLRLAEGTTNTLELEFTSEKSAFDILYGFAGATLTPINEELYTASGDDYASEPKFVASSGLYILDKWTEAQFLSFAKNDLHPDAAMYHYTGYQYRYVDGSDSIFAEFLAGRIDSASVPSARVTEFAGDPRVNVAPDATTWRLNINSFGTEAARDAFIDEHPEIGIKEDFVPEPILQYLEMRQALYFGFNRYKAAVEVVQTYLPAYTYFASTYFIDAESGLSVRGYEEGAQTLIDFGAESFGFFPDAAVDLFKAAVTKGIADGYYTAGTEANPTIIELQLEWASSGSTSGQAMVAEMEKQYETLLFDNENFVGIDLLITDGTFPNQYYDYMMVANTDLGIGGISGSLLDAPSFLDVFNDNNEGGFTLNWGIDTHTANIAVTYMNLEGVEVSEIWGFNALVAALQGSIYVRDGQEQSSWASEANLINTFMTMAETTKESVIDGGTVVAEAVLGDTLANIIDDEEYLGLTATIVLRADGQKVIFVIAEEDVEQFVVYAQWDLYDTAVAAMEGDAGKTLVTHSGPLTDAEIAANGYLGTGTEGMGYDTIASIATDKGSELGLTEIYATNWGWDDAYIVVHTGDYYIAWLWL